MKIANNMDELEQMLRERLQTAMESASDDIHDKIQKHLSEFYSVGDPVYYVRTGNLENSAERTPVVCKGNTVSFTAKLNTTHGYRTGTFSKLEVLEAAETHTAGVLGKPHFWEKSEKDIEKTLKSKMRSNFKK